jgi:hypothetical protein
MQAVGRTAQAGFSTVMGSKGSKQRFFCLAFKHDKTHSQVQNSRQPLNGITDGGATDR